MKSSSSAEAGRSVPPGLLSLDGPGATEAATVGAKAAALARARRVGLPVLPGLVLPLAAGRRAVDTAAAALRERGVGAARPAALRTRLPEHTEAALRLAVERLGGRVIVRSSSPLESDHRWSGAFSSISEVGVPDVGTAVRACWASAFAPDPLDRAEACGVDTDKLALAVLIQPELTPDSGGIARVDGDDVRITAVAGHPGELLSGWATGETITRSHTSGGTGGSALASEADAVPPRVIDASTVGEVAALARRTADLLGHDVIEWAVADGTVYLLQSSRTASAPTATVAGSTPVGDGSRVGGTASVAGDAVGRLQYVRPHEGLNTTEPSILVCDRPVPALAPLLFGAQGLVSVSGPAECHLIGVARAIGVPVLTGTDVARVTGPLDQINAGDWLAAIDGERAELVVLSGPAAVATDLATAVSTITSSLESMPR